MAMTPAATVAQQIVAGFGITTEPAKSVAEAGWVVAIQKIQAMMALATVVGVCPPGAGGGPLGPPTGVT